jgi:DNA-binding MarR family transcriptional regulator/GNAT superfamily N-acetyltransferase
MTKDQVQAVRGFNRALTQRIGALNDSFLGRGRPLGEARLLYEIGAQGSDLRELRHRLALDSGYLSRLLRSLERQRLIVAECAAADARRRIVRLSKRGLSELRQYNRSSDALAKSMLEPLSAAQRTRLLAAMTDVAGLLRVSTLQLNVEPADSGDARWCLRQYYLELAERFDAGFDPARSISATAEELTPPRGVFVIARSMGQPIGCGALKVKDAGVGEIKRMWVARESRGLSVGRRILAALEEQARAMKLHTLRLETNRSLKEAQALYRRSGYREVAPFNDEPYAHHWFEKRFVSGTRRSANRARAGAPSKR